MMFFMTALALTMSSFGQKSIDNLFRKYSDSEEYVTITLNGNLCKLLDILDDDDSTDQDDFRGEITQIRILARNDEYKGGENF